MYCESFGIGLGAVSWHTALIVSAVTKHSLAECETKLVPKTSLVTDGLNQPQRFWAIVTTGIAIFITVVDSSIANVALPTISADLKVDPSATVWIVNAYQIAILLSLL